MELAAAKMIGAGIACIALVGAGIGIGNVFGSYLSGALRNPGAAATQTTNLLLGLCALRSDRPVRPGHRADHPVHLRWPMADPLHASDRDAQAGAGGFPPFKTETFPSQIFWLAVCFAFLFVVLWRVAGPRINGVITSRRGTINADIAAADRRGATRKRLPPPIRRRWQAPGPAPSPGRGKPPEAQ